MLLQKIPAPIQTIAGVDVSLNMFGKDLYAGVIVLSYPGLEPITSRCVKTKVEFPYIPGLLSFREIPGLMQCIQQLPIRPSIYLVDGQGIAHPRHLGIASHLGLLLETPTIGVGKNPLFGQYSQPIEVGEACPIKDPKTRAILGYAYKSKARSKPLFISPGHLVTCQEALAIAASTLRGYRMPEPTRLAHLLTNNFRKGLVN